MRGVGEAQEFQEDVKTGGPGGQVAAPRAEAGRTASGASSLAGTGCDLDITVDSWKNNLEVPWPVACRTCLEERAVCVGRDLENIPPPRPHT